LDSAADAAGCIAGYLTANDLSERTFQIETSGGQWSKGKSAPGFSPLGPWLVTADEVDPTNLWLRSRVNGEPRQDSTTADMIFSVNEIIWHLSQHLALEPGDVILTGTPEGVALSGRFPYLGEGDVVEIEIEGLGRQRQKFGQGLKQAGRKPMTQEFEGLVAIVTGGASGIGASVTRRLIESGAHVAVLDLNIESADPDAFAVIADVGDDASVRSAVAAVAARFGGIDILINNAGIGAQGSVEDNDDAEWARVFSINVTGIARLTRAALPHLRASSHAAIVNTCSIAATAGLPKRALYSASKGAVLALTRAMAADHLREGIRVNCVNPGTADTPWVGRLLAQAADPVAERRALESRQPHGRLVSVEEIADAIAHLASPRSASTTGASLAVDGGMESLRLPALR
jgi:NAD(P)-dependent dehydrogenase (short-subunit alcohol dehydrogenase family)